MSNDGRPGIHFDDEEERQRELLYPHSVDERGIPGAKEAAHPTRDPRVELFQRLRGIYLMTELLAQEVDEAGAMLCSMYGDPRNQHDGDRQPRPEKRTLRGKPLTVEESQAQAQAQAQARQAAQKYIKARNQRGSGPVGGPGTSLR